MALALTRKLGQRIVINAGGERIEVWVSEVTHRNRIKVVVEANKNTVEILRAEIAPQPSKVP